MVEVNGEEMRRYTLAAETTSGSSSAAGAELRGRDPEENAAVTRAILGGRAAACAADLALINAGAAIYAAGGADTIAEGVQAARAALAGRERGGRAGALRAGQPAVRTPRRRSCR